MKKLMLSSFAIITFCTIASSQPIPPDSLYLGQTPPGSIPVVFAPGIVSLPNRNEAVITFSPDGKSIFFYIEKYPQPGTPYTLFMTYTDNHWTSPDTIQYSIGRSTGEPFLAFNGNRVYMFASNAVNHQGVVDLSYSEKQGDTWSDPISMGDPPNSENYQYHPCIVGDTSVYFSSNAGHICRSQYSNGTYQNRVILPKPVNYVGSQTWGDPYVSPDETYLIFKSIRPEGFGQNDLYISYKKTDGSWTNPKNLGNIINTQYDQSSGDVTPDGLYMTYASNKDLHWVSTSFIDSLKYTNFIPYLENPVPDQTIFIGQPFSFTIPDSTFLDDDGNNTLTYDAILANGDPLPSWMAFDTVTGTFSGTPPESETLDISVTAIDTAGASVWTSFKIIADSSTSVYKPECPVASIFPNPGNGLFYISLDKPSEKKIDFEIYTLAGLLVQKSEFYNATILDLTKQPKGIYIIKLFIDNEITVRKISLL
jgi:hypothetical protein